MQFFLKLLVDETCAPADITFPTDLKILNKAREKSEKIIDIFHEPHTGIKKKPRTFRKMARQDEIDRIPIEGKFGQAKRRFSLSRIMCKLVKTSETAIAVVFLVMNLEKWLKVSLLNFFCPAFNVFFTNTKTTIRFIHWQGCKYLQKEPLQLA